MTHEEAKDLNRYHNFTKKELYDILAEAIDSYSEEYWKKPNPINPMFDNGYYFNRCVEWLQYKKETNDDKTIVAEIIAVRILEMWGKFAKVKLPQKKYNKPDIIRSEEPMLPKFDDNE